MTSAVSELTGIHDSPAESTPCVSMRACTHAHAHTHRHTHINGLSRQHSLCVLQVILWGGMGVGVYCSILLLLHIMGTLHGAHSVSVVIDKQKLVGAPASP